MEIMSCGGGVGMNGLIFCFCNMLVCGVNGKLSGLVLWLDDIVKLMYFVE